MTTGAGPDRLASVDLNLLVPLMALLEERSVTRAAARVGLTQPAMSHALGRLRKLLGDELLVRQGSSMVLTPRAVELAGPLSQALGHAAHVVRFRGFDASADRRTITVALTASTAVAVGGHLARLVRERAPHATLRLRTFAVPDETIFTDGGVDVVLLPRGFASPYAREPLYDDQWAVVSARDAAPAGATALDLLRTLPHVVFEQAGRRLVPYLVLEEHQVGYDVRQIVTENLLIPPLVAQLGGVALHRRRVVTAMSGTWALRVDEFPFPVPGLGIDVVWNPRLTDRGFVTWLRGLLREAAAAITP